MEMMCPSLDYSFHMYELEGLVARRVLLASRMINLVEYTDLMTNYWFSNWHNAVYNDLR